MFLKKCNPMELEIHQLWTSHYHDQADGLYAKAHKKSQGPTPSLWFGPAVGVMFVLTEQRQALRRTWPVLSGLSQLGWILL